MQKFEARTYNAAMERVEKLQYPVYIYIPNTHADYGMKDGPVEYMDHLDVSCWLDLIFDDHGDAVGKPVELQVLIWGTLLHTELPKYH